MIHSPMTIIEWARTHDPVPYPSTIMTGLIIKITQNTWTIDLNQTTDNVLSQIKDNCYELQIILWL